ncbi:hypothetical protein AAFF_G00023230 [Aldrovandia affinis]|uniref:Uncharacterized protein n=1 Tax=Aldrovandia affinis TaxID=143900 RepID=A0AAD7T5M5_9TELE|nr:hypothetical protein AAFF_G00023230 [Aldrovandia affinis]
MPALLSDLRAGGRAPRDPGALLSISSPHQRRPLPRPAFPGAPRRLITVPPATGEIYQAAYQCSAQYRRIRGRESLFIGQNHSTAECLSDLPESCQTVKSAALGVDWSAALPPVGTTEEFSPALRNLSQSQCGDSAGAGRTESWPLRIRSAQQPQNHQKHAQVGTAEGRA